MYVVFKAISLFLRRINTSFHRKKMVTLVRRENSYITNQNAYWTIWKPFGRITGYCFLIENYNCTCTLLLLKAKTARQSIRKSFSYNSKNGFISKLEILHGLAVLTSFSILVSSNFDSHRKSKLSVSPHGPENVSYIFCFHWPASALRKVFKFSILS